MVKNVSYTSFPCEYPITQDKVLSNGLGYNLKDETKTNLTVFQGSYLFDSVQNETYHESQTKTYTFRNYELINTSGSDVNCKIFSIDQHLEVANSIDNKVCNEILGLDDTKTVKTIQSINVKADSYFNKFKQGRKNYQ